MPVENPRNGRRGPLKRSPPFLLRFTAHLLHHTCLFDEQQRGRHRSWNESAPSAWYQLDP